MKIEELVKNSSFIEFINKEFKKTIEHATVEDMAIFAFGSLEEALKEFKKYKDNKHEIR